MSPPPRGYTPEEWAAVEEFLDRHTRYTGPDVEAMNREAAENWRRLHPEDTPLAELVG
jgi:hypothetical protein